MASLLSKVYVKMKELPRKQSARLLPLKRRELRAVLKLFYEEGWVDFTLADLEFMYNMSPDAQELIKINAINTERPCLIRTRYNHLLRFQHHG